MILGINIEREELTGSIQLSQNVCIFRNYCSKFNIEDAKTVSAPMKTNVKLTKEMSPKSDDE